MLSVRLHVYPALTKLLPAGAYHSPARLAFGSPSSLPGVRARARHAEAVHAGRGALAGLLWAPPVPRHPDCVSAHSCRSEVARMRHAYCHACRGVVLALCAWPPRAQGRPAPRPRADRGVALHSRARPRGPCTACLCFRAWTGPTTAYARTPCTPRADRGVCLHTCARPRRPCTPRLRLRAWTGPTKAYARTP